MYAAHLLVFCAFLAWCSSYNIDIRTYHARLCVVKDTGFTPVNGLFGYSVALGGRTRTDGQVETWLLVGAPKETQSGSGVPIGDVLTCNLNIKPDGKPLDCTRLPIDEVASGQDKDVKKNQWLGASLYSPGIDVKSIACAPRFQKTDSGKHVMVGRCFKFLRGSSEDLTPCSAALKFCGAGLSAVINKDKKAVIGSVGSNNDKGAVKVERDEKEFYSSPFDQLSENSYVGYSVAVGNFFVTNDKPQEIAAGAPRAEFSGQVKIYSSNIQTLLKTITPPSKVKQRKEFIYFGASVCAVDINNDGYTDLLVGAPFYSDTNGGDEGRVYVYISTEDASGKRTLSLSFGENQDDPGLRGSNNPGARFGWAMHRAGDLNNDGIDDVVIGAPHDQPDTDNDGFGNGAIYIYHGAKDASSIRDPPQQKITAEEVKHYFPKDSKVKQFKQFGYAVAGGVDTDGNKYPDIAVGAWESERAIVFRTRPVMDLTRSLTLSRREIPIDNTDNITNCTDISGPQHCVNATACFLYHGKSVSGPQVLAYTLELDKKTLIKKRVYFRDAQGKKVYQKAGNITLSDVGNQSCIELKDIFVESSSELTSRVGEDNDIFFELRYELISDPECLTTKLCPVLTRSQPSFIEEKATLVLNCSDNTCDYDLGIAISVEPKVITIGRDDTVVALVTLSNKEERAYNPEIRVTHDAVLQYEKVIRDNSVRIEKRTLTSGNASTSELFRYQGILEGGQQIKFKLQYSSRNVVGNKKVLSIHVETYATSGKEENKDNNRGNVTIQVKREAILKLDGKSVPKSLTYPIKAPVTGVPDGNRTDYKTSNASLVGPLVRVTFELSSEGKSPLQNITLKISYPFLKKSGQNYIVYPVDVNVESGNGVCPKPNFNPEKIPDADKDDIPTRQKRSAEVLSTRLVYAGDAFQCNVEELREKDKFTVVFVFRLWVQTLVEYHPNDLVLKIESRYTYTDPLGTANRQDSFAVDIRLSPENPAAESKTSPVWVIIVSVLGGILLLAIAIFVLFKFGFFKRNRPPKDISSPQSDDAPVNPS